MTIQEIAKSRMCSGWQLRYTHQSSICNCLMTFSVYLPPQATTKPVPAVYWLSGLTCNDENFSTKSGAQRYAAELGLALIIPDTSPRGADIIDYPQRYDLGQGAGFYVDANLPPWNTHYQMYSYITKELPQLIETNLPVTKGIKSIMGHSMGGHGALICALKNPTEYKSVSAFAPICNPTKCDWGKECFSTYLGNSNWEQYDATCLINLGNKPPSQLLIHQGKSDEFLANQLLPHQLEKACSQNNVSLTLKIVDHYDHSYNFISSFIGDHLQFHYTYLNQ